MSLFVKKINRSCNLNICELREDKKTGTEDEKVQDGEAKTDNRCDDVMRPPPNSGDNAMTNEDRLKKLMTLKKVSLMVDSQITEEQITKN